MYYGPHLNGAQLPFNFHLMQTPWNADAIARLIRDYEAVLPPGAWPNWVTGNHDQPRIATRIGAPQARIAAMLLLTLRGTPTMYYGEELGMENVVIPKAEVQDPAEKNEPGKGQGRDPERTPMQWDSSHQAGFTTGTPWLRLADDHARINVAALSQQAGSMLSLYRALLTLRNAQPALHSGGVEDVVSNAHTLSYQRTSPGQRFAILLNFHSSEETAPVADGEIAVSTHMDRSGESVKNKLSLRAYEGVIVKL